MNSVTAIRFENLLRYIDTLEDKPICTYLSVQRMSCQRNPLKPPAFVRFQVRPICTSLKRLVFPNRKPQTKHPKRPPPTTFPHLGFVHQHLIHGIVDHITRLFWLTPKQLRNCWIHLKKRRIF